MAPTCYICYEQEINYISKCSTCKKSICLSCYDKIIKRADKEQYEYKCPFCTIHDLKKIEDLEPKQIIKLCDKFNLNKFIINELRAFNELLLSRNIELEINNKKLKEDSDYITLRSQTLTINNNEAKKEIAKLKNIIEKNKKVKKEHLYNNYVKSNFAEFKNKFPDLKNPDIFKEIAKEWKNTKNNQ